MHMGRAHRQLRGGPSSHSDRSAPFRYPRLSSVTPSALFARAGRSAAGEPECTVGAIEMRKPPCGKPRTWAQNEATLAVVSGEAESKIRQGDGTYKRNLIH
jgi:hypothetical protein